MKTQTTNYKEQSIRFTIVSDNGILLNTTDICRCLCISERLPDGIFSESCMDIVGVIEACLSNGKNEVEFVDWLEKQFVGYEMRTPIRPNCDDDWNLK